MNRRYDSTRRMGSERDRYEPRRGNTIADRERYELADRDETGYRGFHGEERGDENDRERTWHGQSARNDDRDRFRQPEQMQQQRSPWDLGREQVERGRAGYGVTSSAGREQFGRHSPYENRDRQRGMYRGDGMDDARTYAYRTANEQGLGYGQRDLAPNGGFGQQRMQQPLQRRTVKGYKRSDERIREDVCDQLGAADDIDPSEIEVMVNGGEVTLTGTVEERRMKFIAEELIERISGVNEIHNQLRVKRNEPNRAASSNMSSNDRAGSMAPSGSNGENGRRNSVSR